MNPLVKSVVAAQALWAKKFVKLAPEAPGERAGVVGFGDGEPATLVAIGDSSAAGCGVATQADGFTPKIALGFSPHLGRPVAWSTHAQLGATMRRVRYRFLPEVHGHPDYLIISAGSNDVMARRTPTEWRDDLSATLDEAMQRASQVVLCSAGPMYASPALPKTLRRAVGQSVDNRAKITQELCAARGIPFANLIPVALPEGF